jgi:hypothetical protein
VWAGEYRREIHTLLRIVHLLNDGPLPLSFFHELLSGLRCRTLRTPESFLARVRVGVTLGCRFRGGSVAGTVTAITLLSFRGTALFLGRCGVVGTAAGLRGTACSSAWEGLCSFGAGGSGGCVVTSNWLGDTGVRVDDACACAGSCVGVVASNWFGDAGIWVDDTGCVVVVEGGFGGGWD